MGWYIFWRTGLAWGHVLWEVMSYRRTCLTVKHEIRNVLHDDMYYDVLVKCNHFVCKYTLKSFWFSLRSAICMLLWVQTIVFIFFFSATFRFPRNYCLQCSSWVFRFNLNVCLVDIFLEMSSLHECLTNILWRPYRYSSGFTCFSRYHSLLDISWKCNEYSSAYFVWPWYFEKP